MAAEYEYVPIIYSINKRKADVRSLRQNARESIHRRDSVAGKVRDIRRMSQSTVSSAGYGYTEKQRGRYGYRITAHDYSDTASVYSPAYYQMQKKRDAASASVARPAFMQKGIVSTILLIMAVFVMLAFVLAGNTQISSINFENAALVSEIEALEQEIEDIKLDITLGDDLEYLQQRAEELGMSSPRADQIVYVPASGDAGGNASFDIVG